MSPLEALMAEALFCSDLQPSAGPSVFEVSTAAELTLLRLGANECAAVVAQEFGDHPEVSARRMVWCIAQVEQAFAPARV